MEFIASGLENGLLIAATIIGIASLLAGIIFTGSYFGRPLGALIVRGMGLPGDPGGAPRSEAETAALEDKVSRTLGAILAFFFTFAALMTELVLQEERSKRGTEGPFGWASAGVLTLKACFEGMVALILVTAFVRVLRLA